MKIRFLPVFLTLLLAASCGSEPSSGTDTCPEIPDDDAVLTEHPSDDVSGTDDGADALPEVAAEDVPSPGDPGTDAPLVEDVAPGDVPAVELPVDVPNDTPPDPCAGVTCSGHGGCAVVSGAPVCACEADYHAEGLACVPNATPISASFVLSAEAPTVQDNVTLDASASAGTGLTYRWDFEGDGVYDTAYAATATLKHRWCAPATYDVTLEVRDGSGKTATATKKLAVSWFGAPKWIGSAVRDDNETLWFALGLDGAKQTSTDLKTDGSMVDQYIENSRQGSDGRVLTTVACTTSFFCGDNAAEIAVVGPLGKTGVFSTADTLPYELLELPDCTWLVAFREAGVILHATDQGKSLGEWLAGVETPTGMELTADGKSVLVALTDQGRIQQYSLAGVDQGRFDAVGKLSSPYALRRQASGRFAVTDLVGKVVEFEADGSFSKVLVPAIASPTSLAPLPDGRLLVTTADDGGGIRVYDPSDDTLGVLAPPAGESWNMPHPASVVVVFE